MPAEDRRRETILGPDELLAEVRVPAQPREARDVYLKAMARATWAFSLASVAVHGVWDGPLAREISIVLGGVAPIPWRAWQAESTVRGRALDGNLARDAGEAAVVGARPLARNGYTLDLVRHPVERALLAAATGRRRHAVA